LASIAPPSRADAIGTLCLHLLPAFSSTLSSSSYPLPLSLSIAAATVSPSL
jgi:hypothetical protein